MKRTNLLSTASDCLLKSVVVCFILAAASSGVSAQTKADEARAAAPPQSTQSGGATADEEFELNIDVRRISEKELRAETAVETDGVRGVQVGVGVVLRASDIEVVLRNVRGHVRFRASLAPVLRLLDARRAPSTQTPPP